MKAQAFIVWGGSPRECFRSPAARSVRLLCLVAIPCFLFQTVAIAETGNLQTEELEVIRALDAKLLYPERLGYDVTPMPLPKRIRDFAEKLRDSPDAYQRAIGFVATGDSSAALELLRALRSETPLRNSRRLYMLEGDLWFFQGKYELAVPPYEYAYALDNDDHRSVMNLALAHLHSRRGDRRLHALHMHRAAYLLWVHACYRDTTHAPENELEHLFNRSFVQLNQASGRPFGSVMASIEGFSSLLELTKNSGPSAYHALAQVGLANAMARDEHEKWKKAEIVSLLEDGIAGLNRDEHPYLWAETSLELSKKLYVFAEGDHVKNIKRAIQLLDNAREEHSPELTPLRWGETEFHRGIAHLVLSPYEKLNHRKNAIACYMSALSGYRRELYPKEWAMIQSNLGSVWSSVVDGDRTENLHRAIQHYSAALEIDSYESHPFGWAIEHVNIATCWAELPTGDPLENMRRAEIHYAVALSVYRDQKEEDQVASVLAALGIGWAKVEGDAAEDALDKCLWYFTEALKVGDSPLRSYVYEDMGDVWYARGNLTNAIESYELALRERRRDESSAPSARLAFNLGNCWLDLSSRDPEQGFAKAIQYYDTALEYFTIEQDIVMWTRLRCSRADANLGLHGAEDETHVKKVIATYKAAQGVFASRNRATEYRIATNRLGQLEEIFIQYGHGTRAEFNSIPSLTIETVDRPPSELDVIVEPEVSTFR